MKHKLLMLRGTPALDSATSASASGVKSGWPFHPEASKRQTTYSEVSAALNAFKLERTATRCRSCTRLSFISVSASCGCPAITIWISFECVVSKSRKQANRFEHRLLQVLRFIHDQDETAAAQHFLEQGLVQGAVHGDHVHAGVVDFEFVQDEAEQLARVALRLEQEHDARGFGQLFHQLIEESRLAHAGLGDQHHESAEVLDSLLQRSQRIAVRRAEVEVRGIRRNVERLLLQTEIGEQV